MLIKKNVLILHPADKSACAFYRCHAVAMLLNSSAGGDTGCYNYALSWQRSVMDRGGLWMDSKSYLERWLRSWFGETLVVNG